MGDGPEAALFRRYRDRIRPRPVLTEVAEGRGTPTEARRREAQALLAAVPGGVRMVALDQGGQALDTEGFVRLLDGVDGPPCFVIGGAEGLDPSVLATAAAVLSLGAMTWPHLLARVLLIEQLYRAYAIRVGHPYHRAARP